MPRDKHSLLKSKERLTAAIEVLQEELKLIDFELRGYRKGIPLNEEYFELKIVPILQRHADGISSSELQGELEIDGDRINTVSFRTFLSRYGAKGKLIKIERYNPPRWRIAPTV